MQLFFDIDSNTQYDVSEHINESTGKQEKKYKIKGIFSTIGEKNRNGRTYPLSEWKREIENYQSNFTSGSTNLLMEWEHPARTSVDPMQAVAKIESLKIDGNYVLGEAILLNNEKANQLKSLIDNGIKICVSSRGVGKVNNGVVSDFHLVTYDIVPDPSDYNATMNGVVESYQLNEGIIQDKSYNIDASGNIIEIKNDFKTEQLNECDSKVQIDKTEILDSNNLNSNILDPNKQNTKVENIKESKPEIENIQNKNRSKESNEVFSIVEYRKALKDAFNNFLFEISADENQLSDFRKKQFQIKVQNNLNSIAELREYIKTPFLKLKDLTSESANSYIFDIQNSMLDAFYDFGKLINISSDVMNNTNANDLVNMFELALYDKEQPKDYSKIFDILNEITYEFKNYKDIEILNLMYRNGDLTYENCLQILNEFSELYSSIINAITSV